MSDDESKPVTGSSHFYCESYDKQRVTDVDARSSSVDRHATTPTKCATFIFSHVTVFKHVG